MPLRTSRLTCATGTSWTSTSHTGTPFDSWRFWIGGSFSAGTGPVAGAFWRSGAWARQAMAANDQARRNETKHALVNACVPHDPLTARGVSGNDGQLDSPVGGKERARPRPGRRWPTARDSAPGLR